jgi:hypothetical protein
MFQGGSHGWAPPRGEFHLAALKALVPWAAEGASSGSLSPADLRQLVRHAFRHPPEGSSRGEQLDRAFQSLRHLVAQIHMHVGAWRPRTACCAASLAAPPPPGSMRPWLRDGSALLPSCLPASVRPSAGVQQLVCDGRGARRGDHSVRGGAGAAGPHVRGGGRRTAETVLHVPHTRVQLQVRVVGVGVGRRQAKATLHCGCSAERAAESLPGPAAAAHRMAALLWVCTLPAS